MMRRSAVTLLREDHSEVAVRVVGEDQIDPAAGRIAWTTPVAQAILGSAPGDILELPTGTVEILSIDARPEPVEP
jgi:transcription elongation GreA/GreB family factor